MNVLMSYVDVSKSKEMSRWQPINEALHNHFSAMKTFLKNHNDISSGLVFLPVMGSMKQNEVAFNITREQTHRQITITL